MLHATSSSSSYASTPSSLPSELNIKSSMRPESMSRYRRITLDSSSELLDRTNSVRFQWVTHACLQQPFNVSDRHAVVEIILESQVKKTLLMLHVLRMDSYKYDVTGVILCSSDTRWYQYKQKSSSCGSKSFHPSLHCLFLVGLSS